MKNEKEAMRIVNETAYKAIYYSTGWGGHSRWKHGLREYCVRRQDISMDDGRWLWNLTKKLYDHINAHYSEMKVSVFRKKYRKSIDKYQIIM